MKLLYQGTDERAAFRLAEGEIVNRVQEAVAAAEEGVDYEKGQYAALRPESLAEARAMVAELIREWEEEGEIGRVLSEWVVASLKQLMVSESKTINAAIARTFMPKDAHRPQGDWSRFIKIAKMVQHLRTEGMTVDRACVTVAQKFYTSEANVKKIYLNHRKDIDDYDDDGHLDLF